jgi:hypothetical protein
MIIKQKGKYLIFIIGFTACFFSFCYAQSPVIKTVVDRNTILIGQQFKLTVTASFSSKNYRLHWLNIPDTMPHFEVINRSDIDSTYDGNTITDISQTFTLTSFDSGQWQFPPFLINFDPLVDDTTHNLFTDSMRIDVSYLPPDSTNELKDIKPIREVDTSRPLWQWIVMGLFVLLLIVGMVWLYRYYKKKKPALPITSKYSPYEEAMMELEALKKEPFTTSVELKIFYSRLTDIFKNYLTRKQNSDYRDKTTGNILMQLNNALTKESLSELASVLRCGDVVKFAKYLPPKEETENCLATMKKVIETIDKNQEQ